MSSATDCARQTASSVQSGRCESPWTGAKCQGHNRCYALAPELFDVDDYGQSVVIGDGTVPPELAEKARLAVANCPEYAITHQPRSENERRRW